MRLRRNTSRDNFADESKETTGVSESRLQESAGWHKSRGGLGRRRRHWWSTWNNRSTVTRDFASEEKSSVLPNTNGIDDVEERRWSVYVEYFLPALRHFLPAIYESYCSTCVFIFIFLFFNFFEELSTRAVIFVGGESFFYPASAFYLRFVI